MKITKLILILFLLATTSLASAQANLGIPKPKNHAMGRSAYTDAKTLKEDTSRAKANEILARYDFNTNAEIIAFLNAYKFPLTALPRRTNALLKDSLKSTIQSASDGGVLSNPKLGIDALGTFIAGRFKQEINIAFLSKLRTEFDSLPYLGELFPESKKVLKASDPYNYPVFMETLRQAFEEDVNNLPTHLPSIIPRLNPGKTDLAESAKLLKIVADPNTLPNIVKILNDSTGLQSTSHAGLQKGIYALAFVANALYNGQGTGEKLFLTGKESEFESSKFRQQYAALLIRQNELYIGTLKPNADKIIALVNQLIPVYSSLAKQIGEVTSQARQDKLTPSLVQESVAVLLNSLKEGVAAYKKLDTTFNATQIDAAILNGEAVNDIARFIIEKKYGLALIDVISFVDNLALTKLTTEERLKLTRYTSFITNVLKAETKDELVQALETSANPVGSYRVKRNSSFNISLNAYAGGFAGTDFSGSSVYGFTAPIGLYLGWGNLGKKNDATILSTDDGTSLGLFLPLIDVGAVTAFRLVDEKTELADVSWSNVFSPGAYLTFGFKKVPVSLNLGGQMGPEVTTIKAGTAVLADKQWYWRVAVTIDIPFFDLYIHQKKLETK